MLASAPLKSEGVSPGHTLHKLSHALPSVLCLSASLLSSPPYLCQQPFQRDTGDLPRNTAVFGWVMGGELRKKIFPTPVQLGHRHQGVTALPSPCVAIPAAPGRKTLVPSRWGLPHSPQDAVLKASRTAKTPATMNELNQLTPTNRQDLGFGSGIFSPSSTSPCRAVPELGSPRGRSWVSAVSPQLCSPHHRSPGW